MAAVLTGIALAAPMLPEARDAASGDPAPHSLSPGTLAFGPPLAVPNPLALTEPNIAVAPDGTVYIATLAPAGVPVVPGAPGPVPAFRVGQTGLWRLSPEDEAFTALDVPNDGFGGLDETIAVGPDGRLHVASLYMVVPIVPGVFPTVPTNLVRCVSVTTSDDEGATWSAVDTLACHVPRSDRPWIAVDGAGATFVTAAAGGPEAPHMAAWSPTGAGPFAPAGVVQPVQGGFPGNLFVDRDAGIVYEASPCQVPPPLSVCLARSPTATPLPVWEQGSPIRMSSPPIGLKRVVGAVDDGGNVYVTWLDRRFPDSTHGVYLARSTDRGDTWSAPVRISGANVGSHPWVAAGAEGNVAVAWYENDRWASSPENVPLASAWTVVVATKLGGWETPASGWDRAVATPAPNHFGPICLEGVSCAATDDRSLGEFFEIAVGPDGRVHAVWSDDVVGAVHYAAQISGAALR